MEQVRECGSNKVNTGISKCPLVPEYIKAIILAEVGVKLPVEMTLENMEKAFHADRPNRMYGVKEIVEYAPNGGDAQTSATGYGPNEVTGYAAYTAALTLKKFDAGFRANIMRLKDVPMQAWYVDKNGIIWGERAADGTCKGIDLSGLYISGQDFPASGTKANNVINLMYNDVEKAWMNPMQVVTSFDVLSVADGLRFVDVVKKTGSENEYYVLDHYDKLNVGKYFSTGLAEVACWKGVTAVEYVQGSGTFKLTPKESASPMLAAPSVLQENGVTGIEQWA
ncbi:hypothetical protein [Bacteroides sp.]|uniref:hypothetical protein n=1 Tax=Bacteroides sp. TaxID=29523 RepID=UPI002FC6B2E0